MSHKYLTEEELRQLDGLVEQQKDQPLGLLLGSLIADLRATQAELTTAREMLSDWLSHTGTYERCELCRENTKRFLNGAVKTENEDVDFYAPRKLRRDGR